MGAERKDSQCYYLDGWYRCRFSKAQDQAAECGVFVRSTRFERCMYYEHWTDEEVHHCKNPISHIECNRRDRISIQTDPGIMATRKA